MPNAWVEFVRQYARENNLSYGCAISEASPAYRKMKQEAKLPKTPTKKRITIKKTKNNVENALNILKKMKEKEDDLLDQIHFYTYQYLAWSDSRNDTPRRNKYKEIKNKIKEECGKSNSDCEEVYDDIKCFFEKEFDYYTMKVFLKILKRFKMPNYKIPTETNNNKIKKNDEDYIKEFAENNDMTIKEAVGQLKTVFL